MQIIKDRWLNPWPVEATLKLWKGRLPERRESSCCRVKMQMSKDRWLNPEPVEATLKPWEGRLPERREYIRVGYGRRFLRRTFG